MTDPRTGESNILKFLAVGRLAAGSSAGAVVARQVSTLSERSVSEDEKRTMGKHQVLAFASASKDERTKTYKHHVKELMSKGASRLAGGKRVRLLSDEDEEGGERYELNVLTEYIDDDPNAALVFFAITCMGFGKHQSISSLFRELKHGVYERFPSEILANTQSSGPMHAQLKPFFEQLFNKYNRSALLEVNRKVEGVKAVMKDNVNKALNNVEQLEEMEVKAERMEGHARQFERRSKKVSWLMRCRSWKITIIVALVVIALLTYLIWYIASRTRTIKETTQPDTTPDGPT